MNGCFCASGLIVSVRASECAWRMRSVEAKEFCDPSVELKKQAKQKHRTTHYTPTKVDNGRRIETVFLFC